MPVSRKRRPRPTSRRRNAHRKRPAYTSGPGLEEVPLRTLLAEPPDTDTVECLRRGLEAGARGDAEDALKHELSGAYILQNPCRFMLHDLIEQGADAPPWAYSRWCADLAYRSMLMAEDPRADEAVRFVMATLHTYAVQRVADDPIDFRVLGASVAASDHVAQDIALYALGGLRDYLEHRAGPGLLMRCDRIREWVDSDIGAYELVQITGCRLVLRSFADGGQVEALNIGAASQAGDEAFVGRLVPITAEPGLMFATRPMTVDRVTAQAVAASRGNDDPLAWVWALSDAVGSGRATEGFHHTETTLYTSDLPLPDLVFDRNGVLQTEESEAGRIVELRAKGYPFLVANAVGVLEVGLIAAQVSDRSAAVVAPHVAAALATPGAYAAAARECVGPGTARAWRILAAAAPDHVADRLNALADLAAANLIIR